MNNRGMGQRLLGRGEGLHTPLNASLQARSEEVGLGLVNLGLGYSGGLGGLVRVRHDVS